MKILRIMTPDWHGCYQMGDGHSCCEHLRAAHDLLNEQFPLDECEKSERRPVPFNDDLLSLNLRSRYGSDWIKEWELFGFKDERQLFRWYSPEELSILRLAGLDVYEIEVPADFVIEGNCQVIFDRRHVTNWTKHAN